MSNIFINIQPWNADLFAIIFNYLQLIYITEYWKAMKRNFKSRLISSPVPDSTILQNFLWSHYPFQNTL